MKPPKNPYDRFIWKPGDIVIIKASSEKTSSPMTKKRKNKLKIILEELTDSNIFSDIGRREESE